MAGVTYNHVTKQFGKQSYIARVDPRSQARPGKSIDVMMNLDRLHIFNLATEQTIR